MTPAILPIYNNLKDTLSNHDFKIIDNAFLFAEQKHRGQKRKSGENYILHPLRVAIEVSKLKLDLNSIVAALLHDVLEDTDATGEEIEKLFGVDVRFLVESLSQLQKLKRKANYKNKSINRLENLRNLILSSAKDVRVILIKIVDRLDNMKSLWSLGKESQVENAEETLEIFAPICKRLGFNFLGQQLEEISFPYVYPKEFLEIKNRVVNCYYEIEKLLMDARNELDTYLRKNHLKFLEIQFRKKSFFSIFKKYKKEGDFNKIYDIIALRVIVENIGDCYTTLGLVHQLWLPLPDRVKDYISLPKVNGYKALHTTVLTNNNQIVEVQIVTKEMYHDNEYGIASHWLYNLSKDTKAYTKRQDISGTNVLYKTLQNLNLQDIDSKELFNIFVKDLLSEQIFVVTPKGDVIDLKKDSTPIDFAYKIHTDIGNHCKMAKVNKQVVPLNHILQSGDVIEISIDKRKMANKGWLDIAKMSETKSRIKKAINIK